MLDTLFAKLQTATDPMADPVAGAGRSGSNGPWCPTPAAPADDARHRRDAAAASCKQSVETFTKLIEIAPELSEAWNKRATAYWLLGNFPASLADICETVKREPRHFGAYSGLGMIRAQMGEYPRAVAAFELAKKYNPHIVGIDDEIDAPEGDGRRRARRSAGLRPAHRAAASAGPCRATGARAKSRHVSTREWVNGHVVCRRSSVRRREGAGRARGAGGGRQGQDASRRPASSRASPARRSTPQAAR